MTEQTLDKRGRQIPNLPAGSYAHYKGDIYQVLGLGHDSNDPDRLVVVYYAPPGKGGPALAIRNLFHDVDFGDGSGFFDWVDPVTSELADKDDPDYWPLPFTTAYEQAVAAGEGDDKPMNRPHAVRRFTYVGPFRP
jgi:hypothetical protein